MKRISLGAGFVAALVCAASLHTAQAADLGVKAPPAAPPAYDWTGFYVGAQGGYGFGEPEFDLTTPYLQDAWRADGGFGGGTIGAQYEFGATHFVVGVEGEYNAGELKGSTTDTLIPPNNHSATVTNFGSIDAKVGFALVGTPWDHMLLYMSGGAAFGNPEQTFSFKTTSPSVSLPGGEKVGWSFGSGIDMYLTTNWIVRGEWRMYDFGIESLGAGRIPGFPATTAGTHETVNTARAGVIYKF